MVLFVWFYFVYFVCINCSLKKGPILLEVFGNDLFWFENVVYRDDQQLLVYGYDIIVTRDMNLLLFIKVTFITLTCASIISKHLQLLVIFHIWCTNGYCLMVLTSVTGNCP